MPRPSPPTDLARLQLEDLDVTVDALTSALRIVQRRRGHRHSTDDLLTAWYAAEHVPLRDRVLDLGSGVGSVGLCVLHRSPGAIVTAVEAQEVSYRLLSANVALNQLEARVRPVHGDLREVRFDAPFDLVTGSPPYFDVKAGVVSADSQRAHARFELRGDVRDYCAAALAALAPGGRFVFCFPTNQRERAERAVRDQGLVVERSRDVVPRAGVAPLFSVFVCRRAADPGEAEVREPDHVVRDANGEPTAAHLAARATFGMGR